MSDVEQGAFQGLQTQVQAGGAELAVDAGGDTATQQDGTVSAFTWSSPGPR